MKKIVMMLAVAAATGCAFAWPCGPCGPGWGPGPGWGHCPPPHHWGGGGFWGRGGCNFWPGFAGGLVGSALVGAFARPTPNVVVTSPVVTSPIVTTPVVASPIVVQTSPVVVRQPAIAVGGVRQTQQTVWVEGSYISRPRGDGTVVREWNPGHYETRNVICQ